MSTHGTRSEEHTSELQSHSEISYAVFCLKNKNYTMAAIPKFRSSMRTGKKSSCHGRSRPGSAAVSALICLSPQSFFFTDTPTTEIYTLSYTLSLHDALPISLHDALPISSSHIQKSRMPSSACDWS